MSAIDFQNGFLCGMAIKGLTKTATTGGSGAYDLPAVLIGVTAVLVSDFFSYPAAACIVAMDAVVVSQIISYSDYLLI